MIPYTPPKLSWPKDWFIKLISLLFAVFLWYFVSSEDRVDMNIQIPVEIVNLPRDLIIANQYKTVLDVMVTGPRGLIRRVSSGITRSIDLSKATAGTTVLANDLDSISVPAGVTVLRISPTHINLRLDRLITKELPIKAITGGRLPPEYELASITMQPEQLEIAGPQDIVEPETILETIPIDLSDVTSSTSKQVDLDLKPALADLIGDPVVSAKIEIRDKLIEREISGIEITLSGLTATRTATISPRRVDTRVMIPMALSKKQNRAIGELFTATVNLEGLTPGPHKLKPVITTPPGVTVEQMLPETVKVEIK